MDRDEMIPKTPKNCQSSDPVDSYHTFSEQFIYSESLSDIKMKNILYINIEENIEEQSFK